MEKVLITGANGYIGFHVLQNIQKLGYKPIASDIKNTKYNSDIIFFEYDILNNPENKNLYEYFGKPDHLIHLAWQDGFNHYAPSHMANLTKHYKFLKSFIDGGIKSLTVMGTAHEIGYHEGRINENTPCNPLSFYGVAKNTLRQLMLIETKDKDISLKWLRAYYITGDDMNNHSVFTKILEAAKEGKTEFPFTKGTNQFDFIDISELAKQISYAAVQTKVNGIINVCSGEPVALKDKVEQFIENNNLNIKLKYGVFPQRKYDSPVVYGDERESI